MPPRKNNAAFNEGELDHEGVGLAEVSGALEMACYDRLPARVRQAIAYAPLAVTATTFYNALRFGLSIDHVIGELDKAMLATVDRKPSDLAFWREPGKIRKRRR